MFLRLALGVFLLTVVTIILAPAALLDMLVNHWSEGKVRLVQTDGTLWKGSAYPLIRVGSKNYRLDRWQWKLDNFGLLKGKVLITFQTKPDRNPAKLSWDFVHREYSLSNLELDLPVAALDMLSKQLATYQFTGYASINLAKMQLDHSGFLFQAGISWERACSQLANLCPFGAYHFGLDGQGSRVAMKITTKNGPLVLSGISQFDLKAGGLFSAFATPQKGYEDKLSGLLPYLGQEVSAGVYQINLPLHFAN